MSPSPVVRSCLPLSLACSDYVGIPFKEKGRDRNGCDCWGLVRLVLAERYGFDLPDLSDGYATTKDAAAIVGLYDGEKSNWRKVEQGQPGDVLVLRIKGRPTHVGLVIGEGRFLHVDRGIDATIERYDSPHWRNRVEAFYRHR